MSEGFHDRLVRRPKIEVFSFKLYLGLDNKPTSFSQFISLSETRIKELSYAKEGHMMVSAHEMEQKTHLG